MLKSQTIIFKFQTLCVLFLLMANCPAFAQWSGSIEGLGAWNLHKNNTENAKLHIKYDAKKTYLSANMLVGHDYNENTESTYITDSKQRDNLQLEDEFEWCSPKSFEWKGDLDFGYKFNKYNMLTIAGGMKYVNEKDNPYTLNYCVSNSRDSIFGIEDESTEDIKRTIDTGIKYTHDFNTKGRKLQFNVGTTIERNSKDLDRTTAGPYYNKPKTYFTKSKLDSYDHLFMFSYDDNEFFNIERLKMNTGVACYISIDDDHYNGSTWTGTEWKDSIDLRQNFNYKSYTGNIFVNAQYKAGKFDFGLKECLQFYNHSLNDEVGSSASQLQFDKNDLQNLINAFVSYTFNQHHELRFNYSRNIVRPKYKNLCATLTIGKSDGEYFRGNPNLKPETTNMFNLTYKHTREHFTTTIGSTYQIKKNTAEKIIDVIPSQTAININTLYTWANTQRQQTLITNLKFTADYNELKASIWANMLYNVFDYKKKASKKEESYEFGLDMTAMLTKTIIFYAQLQYQGAKYSAYNSKGEYVGGNLRATKYINKDLELYLEVKELIDKEQYEQTWNEELTYYKIKQIIPNRRALVLGVKYRF